MLGFPAKLAWMQLRIRVTLSGVRVNLPSRHGCNSVLGLRLHVLGLICQVVMNTVTCGHARTVSKLGYGMAPLYLLVCLVQKYSWDIFSRNCVSAVESHMT